MPKLVESPPRHKNYHEPITLPNKIDGKNAVSLGDSKTKIKIPQNKTFDLQLHQKSSSMDFDVRGDQQSNMQKKPVEPDSSNLRGKLNSQYMNISHTSSSFTEGYLLQKK